MNIETKHPADFGKDEVYDATFGGDTGKDADYAEKNHSLDGNPDKLPNEDPEDYANKMRHLEQHPSETAERALVLRQLFVLRQDVEHIKQMLKISVQDVIDGIDGEPTTADEHNEQWQNEVGSETGIETEKNYEDKI